MKIILGGAGEVGFHIARVLRGEGHDIVIIENDPDMLKRAKSIDALVMRGNAASPDILEEAGINMADIFIAVTGSDEVNLFSSAVAAAKLTQTIARVDEFGFMKPVASDTLERLGIKKVSCPDLVAAETLVKLIETPSVMDVSAVAGGDAWVLVLRATGKSPVVGKSLSTVGFPPEAKVMAVYEDRDLIMATPDYKIKAGQRAVLILNDLDMLGDIEKLFGTRSMRKVKKVFIAGANDIGIYIAQRVERKKEVTLMDSSPEKARRAAELLKKTIPNIVDTSNRREMRDVGIDTADVFIAVGESEEHNALSCFFAKRLGAKRTMAMIENADLADMSSNMGVDIVVNPRWATVGAILEAVHEVEYASVRLMHRDEAQLIEFEVSHNSGVVGRTVKNVDIQGEAVIAAIVRRGMDDTGKTVRKVKIARENDLLMAEDHLIVFAFREGIPKIRRRLK